MIGGMTVRPKEPSLTHGNQSIDMRNEQQSSSYHIRQNSAQSAKDIRLQHDETFDKRYTGAQMQQDHGIQLQQRVKELEDQIKEMSKKAEEFDQDELTAVLEARYAVEREKLINQFEAAFDDQEKQKGKRDQQILSLQGDNSKLQESLAQQEKIIRQTQEAAFRMTEQGAWTPDPDSAIADELKSLEASIRDFCKQYAIESAEGNTLKTMHHATKKELQEILTEDGWTALEASRMSKTAPWLFLSAWLSRFICNEFLKAPFYYTSRLDQYIFPAVENSTMKESLWRAFYILEYGK
jgi:hypothetical protein